MTPIPSASNRTALLSSKISSLSQSSYKSEDDASLEPATLIYHESARSIVFRDHLRRQASSLQEESESTHSHSASSVEKVKKKIQSKKRQEKEIKNIDMGTVASIGTANISRQEQYKSSVASMKSDASHSQLTYSSGKTEDDEETSACSSVDTSTRNSTNNMNAYGGYAFRSVENVADVKPQIIIANFTPVIEPLPALDLGPQNEFEELMLSAPFVLDDGPGKSQKDDKVWASMTKAEQEVSKMLQEQKCVVKTVRNADWTAFLEKFAVKDGDKGEHFHHPADYRSRVEKKNCLQEVNERNASFHSFMTSTSLLPSCGVKMRCYGSTKEFTTGVVFALPTFFPKDEEKADEDAAAKRTKTWSWPSGYSAKTEFNIDHYGKLINGREEALVTLSSLRKMNHSFVHDEDYEIGGRIVKGGLKTIPYNEVFVRVGGLGRIVDGVDCKTGKVHSDADGTGRSFDYGLGLPVALFVRTTTYGDLIALLRLRARMAKILGRNQIHGIPLVFITPETGVRVLTENLQKKLLHIMSSNLNPFQNPLLSHKTQMKDSSERHLQQKLEELLDLDDDNIRDVLTPEECARLAGGFGATDGSVANLLMDAMVQDKEQDEEIQALDSDLDKLDFESGRTTHQGKLQDLVNEGLAAAVRSGDYNTSRQLLILYTLVASKGQQCRTQGRSFSGNASIKETDLRSKSITIDYDSDTSSKVKSTTTSDLSGNNKAQQVLAFSPTNNKGQTSSIMAKNDFVAATESGKELNKHPIPPPPPPPPLDTDRLRSATNSDGLLAVLGAAEVLKSMQDGTAKSRVEEAAQAIDEWIGKSENSVAFRLASWRDQRAAQGDLRIATESDSNFMAFISNKAILNRKSFANQLRQSIATTNFESISFLKAIHEMVSNMHSPCLRLELLQFILGLDNRYSVAHVARSVELAATCLSISAYEAMQANNFQDDRLLDDSAEH